MVRWGRNGALWVPVVLLVGSGGGLAAQQPDLGLRQSRGDLRHDHDYALNVAVVRETGQPVIPIFEGWIPKPDGTITLSFSYFNLNSMEPLDIPFGPDNYMEPREFDGAQPTHFAPAAECCNRRHLSAFTVTVPGDFEGDVVWTLRSQGREYSVPGRAVHEAYRMDDLEAYTISPVAPGDQVRPGPGGALGTGPLRRHVLWSAHGGRGQSVTSENVGGPATSLRQRRYLEAMPGSRWQLGQRALWCGIIIRVRVR